MQLISTPFFNRQTAQAGFVLPTSLVLLALLTVLALSVYFGSLSTEKMSAAAQRTTQGYYYAETAANYMQWALATDAEMDSYANYSGSYLRNGAGTAPFAEPVGNFPTVYGTFATVGDRSELAAYLFNPGPVEISDTAANGRLGQVKYFDNSPLAARAIKWPDAKTNAPTFEDIYTQLPRYIIINIDANGNITPTIPKLPHGGGNPIIGNDIPRNGAIVWLTGGLDDGPSNGERDIQVVPLDSYSCAWNLNPKTVGGCDTGGPTITSTGVANSFYPAITAPPTAVTYPNGQSIAPYPVTSAGSCGTSAADPYAFAQACDAYSGWLTTSYRTVIYALGYVNGKAMRLVRKTY